jgi:hypothetical protein
MEMSLQKLTEMITSGLSEPLQKVQDQKEIYNLWREFLKRSSLYRQAIQWLDSAIGPELSPVQFLRLHDPSLDDEMRLLDTRAKMNGWFSKFESNPDEYPDPSDEELSFAITNILKNYFVFFGDVFSEDFDSFWDRASSFLIEIVARETTHKNLYDRNWPPGNDPVVPIDSEMLGTFFEESTAILTETLGHPPSVDDFINHLKANISNRVLVTAVRLNFSNQDIISALKPVLKEERTNRNVAKQDLFFTFCRPSGPIDEDAHRRYLEVFDLKVGRQLTWNELFRHYFTDIDPEYDDGGGPNLMRALKADLRKARKIISNVESGVYPGKIN